MSTPQVKADYNCSQEALYTIAEIGWDSCLENITGFAAAKPKYTPAFIAAAQAANTPAQNLGTSKARAAWLCALGGYYLRH